MLTLSKLKQFFSTKVAVGVLALVLFFLLFQFSQVFYQRYATDKEIADYQNEIVDLENHQKRLNDALGFLNTDFFAEREARVKLGMEKPGEVSVVLPEERLEDPKPEAVLKKEAKKAANDERRLGSIASNTEPTDSSSAVKKNNATRWWSYFFGEN